MPYTHTGPALYRTEDDQVVPEGDPRARFLLIADGGSMADDEAARYGLSNAKAKVDEKAKPTAEANKAQPEPPTNKAKG